MIIYCDTLDTLILLLTFFYDYAFYIHWIGYCDIVILIQESYLLVLRNLQLTFSYIDLYTYTVNFSFKEYSTAILKDFTHGGCI